MTKDEGLVSRRVRELTEFRLPIEIWSCGKTNSSHKAIMLSRVSNFDGISPPPQPVLFHEVSTLSNSRKSPTTGTDLEAPESKTPEATVLWKAEKTIGSATPYRGLKARSMSAKIAALGPRRRQSSCDPVPSMIYIHPIPSQFNEETNTSKTENDHKSGFRADVFIMSAARSALSSDALNDVHLECFNKLKDFGMAEWSDECQKCEKRQSGLNPNAPIFVPSSGETESFSSSNTIATAVRRTPFQFDGTRGAKILRRLINIQSNPVTPPQIVSACMVTRKPQLSIQTRLAPKVTTISDKFKIFVIDLLSDEECDLILHHTEQHVAQASNLGTETWRKLFTHTQFDLPCCEVLPLRPLTNQLLIQVRRILGHMFNARRATSRLAPRSWKEPHLLRYQKIPGMPENTGMIMHYDGSHMTWQLMLSTHQRDYTGGGTYFRCIRKTIMLQKGQILIHPGNLYHRGVDISSGSRTLMVCFMDGFDPKVIDGSNPHEDSAKFEQNVVVV